jgi:hypothetical protein
MGWLFFIIAIVAVGVVTWDTSLRGKRGRAFALSVAAVAVVIGAGMAQAAGLAAPWPLVGLVFGAVLFVLFRASSEC